MATDKTDTTSPVSRVDNRLVSPTRVRQAKNVGIDVRLNQARRDVCLARCERREHADAIARRSSILPVWGN